MNLKPEIVIAATVAAFAALGAAASPAAACKHAHVTPFEAFDGAARAAIATVVAVGADATLDVTRELRGDSNAAALILKIGTTDCAVRVHPGDTVLVFVDANGWPIGAEDGVLRDPARWEHTIEAWSNASSDAAARAAVLVDAIASGDDTRSVEASRFMIDEPGLVAALDTTQRERLGNVTPAQGDRYLSLLLVRLRDPSAGAKLPPWATLAKQVARVSAFESESDVTKIAAAIERGPIASRMAAFERCERVQHTRLKRFSRYIEGLETPRVAAGWRVLADSCRTGTAVP